jgi:hypothetical protein
MVDSNGNGQLDVTDKVFEIQGEGMGVVAGDFDGDGMDEAALFSNRRSEIVPEEPEVALEDSPGSNRSAIKQR